MTSRSVPGAARQRCTAAAEGTIGREASIARHILFHQVNGSGYKTKISTLRGDYQKPDGTIGNRLRHGEKHDFKPRPDDIFQERLYCVQWMRPRRIGKGDEYEFRSVTEDDLTRENASSRSSCRASRRMAGERVGARHADRGQAGHHAIKA